MTDASESTRSRRDRSDEGFLGACDFTSYCYFTLAVVLFTLGTVVTVFALDDGTATLFSSLGHMWLVGPIFISSGLMVAVKTVLYLRKKNLMTFLLRQRDLFRELQSAHIPLAVARNVSAVTLPPPSYDSAIGQRLPGEGRVDGRTRISGSDGERGFDEMPPPSYEEAMVLIGGDGVVGPWESSVLRSIAPPGGDRQNTKDVDA